MVEYHVTALGNSDGILSRLAASAHPDADIPGDGLVGVGPGEAIAIDCDALVKSTMLLSSSIRGSLPVMSIPIYVKLPSSLKNLVLTG